MRADQRQLATRQRNLVVHRAAVRGVEGGLERAWGAGPRGGAAHLGRVRLAIDAMFGAARVDATPVEVKLDDFERVFKRTPAQTYGTETTLVHEVTRTTSTDPHSDLLHKETTLSLVREVTRTSVTLSVSLSPCHPVCLSVPLPPVAMPVRQSVAMYVARRSDSPIDILNPS